MATNKIEVLDHGYVELLSYTPNGDLLVVNAARCSFDKEHNEFDEEADQRLLDFLARERHWLPFRHPSATIRIHVPIFVARQLGKHQVGFSWSEVSRRYIKGMPDMHIPSKYRNAAENVKQGSSESVNSASLTFLQISKKLANDSLLLYDDMLRNGVCPEQARVVLPQSMYTTAVWTGSMLSWHTMTDQRLDGHAQKETREFAKAVYDIMAEIFPHSWTSLKTYGQDFSSN